MTRLAYVCVISDFTLPTLEACLSLKPAHILLIVSDSLQAQASRLHNVLQERLPTSRIELLSQATTEQPLHGDDLAANHCWLTRHLVPRLQELDASGVSCVANITGGTKAMTLPLVACYAWQRLDYQSIGNRPMQSVAMSARPVFAPLPTAVAELVDALPLDIARLHNEKTRSSASNPLREQHASLPLAQQIWQAQHQQDTALLALFAGFERIWVHESSQHLQDSITLDWASFLSDRPAQPNRAELLSWVQRLGALTALPLLHADAQGISMPGNKPKKEQRHLRNWISGDWLEQLALHWLLEDDIAHSAIACNTTGADKDASGSQREADLLVHHAHITSLIEVKAGLPPEKAPGDLENQLSSLGSRFGKTRKALLLGPQLLQSLRQQKKSADFWYRCRANQVTLLLTPEQLKSFVRGKNPWPKLPNEAVPAEFSSRPLVNESPKTQRVETDLPAVG